MFGVPFVSPFSFKVMVTCVISETPNQLHTACTLLDVSRLSKSPSNSFKLLVTPKRDVKCPPAEEPQTPILSGLILNSFAFFLMYLIAAFAS